MIRVETSGSTKNLEASLKKLNKGNISKTLNRLGAQGVAALAKATPVDSGIASSSWGYTVKQTRSGVGITWTNSNVEGGFPVAIMLQYGYSTGTGGYVAGRDYINPAIRPIFEKISDEVWREVTRG